MASPESEWSRSFDSAPVKALRSARDLPGISLRGCDFLRLWPESSGEHLPTIIAEVLRLCAISHFYATDMRGASLRMMRFEAHPVRDGENTNDRKVTGSQDNGFVEGLRNSISSRRYSVDRAPRMPYERLASEVSALPARKYEFIAIGVFEFCHGPPELLLRLCA